MRIINILLPLLLVLLAGFSANRGWQIYMDGPWTRDGRILSEVIQVAPRVSGQLQSIAVIDNQFVNEGDLLFAIDPTDFEVELEQAEANLSQAKAALGQAKNVGVRDESLPKDLISDEQVEADELSIASAEAAVLQFEAARNQAAINLSRVNILAPTEGYVTNLNQRVGNYVSTGQTLVALVESQSYYAMGYFEEIKAAKLRKGMKVRVTPLSSVDTYEGTIVSVGKGIQDGSADRSGLLPNVQPTVPWVRLGQRVPVRVSLDNLTAEQRDLITVGVTCSIEVLDVL